MGAPRCCSHAGPDIICRWWTSAITMAISWLQGDDASVRSHFTEVERVPKALEVTECVSSLIVHLLLSKGILCEVAEGNRSGQPC